MYIPSSCVHVNNRGVDGGVTTAHGLDAICTLRWHADIAWIAIAPLPPHSASHHSRWYELEWPWRVSRHFTSPPHKRRRNVAYVCHHQYRAHAVLFMLHFEEYANAPRDWMLDSCPILLWFCHLATYFYPYPYCHTHRAVKYYTAVAISQKSVPTTITNTMREYFGQHIMM